MDEKKEIYIPPKSFLDDCGNILEQYIDITLNSGELISGRVKKIDRVNMVMTIALGEDLFNSDIRNINIYDINREYGINIKWVDKAIVNK